jgi:hypothetical protein
MKRIDYEVPRVDVAVKKFERHLRSKGYQESTIQDYVGRLKRYLDTVNSPEPTQDQAIAFRESLVDKRLSWSSINNYSFAIQIYHTMLGASIKLPYMSRGEELPYFFNEADIQEIFYCTLPLTKRGNVLRGIA